MHLDTNWIVGNKPWISCFHKRLRNQCAQILFLNLVLAEKREADMEAIRSQQEAMSQNAQNAYLQSIGISPAGQAQAPAQVQVNLKATTALLVFPVGIGG